MKKVIDITGEIYNGMWSYGKPFPDVHIRPLDEIDWVKYSVYCEVFDGMNSQCGTYLETPAHLLGNKSYPLIDVDAEKLVDIPAVILNVGDLTDCCSAPITLDMIKNCAGASLLKKGQAVLICTSWGKLWKEETYLSDSPYITREAMDFLISQEPFLLASDFPRWDNLKNPQGFWNDFYNADILMLAPCVNLELAQKPEAELTVLPVKVTVTSCAPCRAVLKV